MARVLHEEFPSGADMPHPRTQTKMKYPIKTLLGSGLAISLTLTSCVVPYESATVTTYRPGYVSSSLPNGYRTEVIGGVDYYHSNGVYYRRNNRPGEYVVVDAPGNRHLQRQERIVTELPRGYRTVRRSGTTYYYHGNTYYQRKGNGYVIAEIR